MVFAGSNTIVLLFISPGRKRTGTQIFTLECTTWSRTSTCGTGQLWASLEQRVTKKNARHCFWWAFHWMEYMEAYPPSPCLGSALLLDFNEFCWFRLVLSWRNRVLPNKNSVVRLMKERHVVRWAVWLENHVVWNSGSAILIKPPLEISRLWPSSSLCLYPGVYHPRPPSTPNIIYIFRPNPAF